MSYETLIEAMKKGDLEVVNSLLQNEFVLKEVIRKIAFYYHDSALRIAIRNGHLAIVNRLLEISAVLRDADFGNVPLSYAAKGGCLAIVNRLLAKNRQSLSVPALIPILGVLENFSV